MNPQFRVEIATELIQAIRDNDRNAISKRIQIDSKEWEKLVNTREKFTGDFKIETQTKLLWPLEDNDLIISFKSGTILQCKFHDQDIAETGSIKIYACKIEDKK